MDDSMEIFLIIILSLSSIKAQSTVVLFAEQRIDIQNAMLQNDPLPAIASNFLHQNAIFFK